jgi:hypothetical protein
MTYRLLQPDEWDRLKDIMDAKYIPHPDTAQVAIAEDGDGNIIGALFLQLTLHMEPLVLLSPKANFERLHDVLLDAVKDNKGLHVYVFSDKEIIDRMAEHVGMRKLPHRVFEQEVQ